MQTRWRGGAYCAAAAADMLSAARIWRTAGILIRQPLATVATDMQWRIKALGINWSARWISPSMLRPERCRALDRLAIVGS